MNSMRNTQPVLALMPHARTIIRHYLRIKPQEKLAICWDETVSAELVQATRLAAQEAEAQTCLITYEPLTFRPLGEFCFFAGRSLKEPLHLPPLLLAGMRAADAIIMFMSDMEMQLSPDFPELLSTGKRILVLPYLDGTTARRALFTGPEPVETLCAETHRCADVFERGKMAHVTSPEGTDLTLALGQWPVRRHTGLPRSGEMQILPGGQVTRVPNDGTAEGRLVVDRSIATPPYKELVEPIVLQIEKGDVAAVEGGAEAKLLRDFLRASGDPHAYHLTELGIGLNPLSRFGGLEALGEDTHLRGTVSFALGCDTHVGGGTPGPFHIDMTLRFPTLKIDDVTLVYDGGLITP